MAYLIKKCEFIGYKVSQDKDGVYLGVNLKFQKKVSFNIFDESFKLIEKIELPLDCAIGNVFSCKISNLSLKDRFYCFEADGVKIIDPYSRIIVGNSDFGTVCKESDLLSKILPATCLKGFDKDKTLKHIYSDCVFYEAHIRGLTMADPAVKTGKGTFKGALSKAKYLNKLGVTSVIFMPVYERIEKEKAVVASNLSYKDINNELPVNYWGFGPGYYYALKESYSYSSDPSYEFKAMVKAYHDQGIEVILTFDFCMKPYEEIADIMRYWIQEYHIDGFRIFGSCEFAKFLNDPFLKDTKLIFNNTFEELNDIKSVKYKNIGIIDNSYRNTLRRFLKSDEDCVGNVIRLIKENHNNYALIRSITDFDGFSLADLVSYDRKHNEENGEDNNDGTIYNYSWNCGIEGDTVKKNVLKLRNRQIKNALLLLFLSQGSPMIAAGDEFLNTNYGNNNPYCQDNQTGWVTHRNDKMAKDINKFLVDLIMFKKNHFILHQPFELKGVDYLACKIPDISFHSEEAWMVDKNPDSRSFSMLLGGDYAKAYTGQKETSIFVVFNMHWEERKFWLPNLDKDMAWRKVIDTNISDALSISDDDILYKDDFYYAKGRSVTVFVTSK